VPGLLQINSFKIININLTLIENIIVQVPVHIPCPQPVPVPVPVDSNNKKGIKKI
jgi:hypothetical protein